MVANFEGRNLLQAAELLLFCAAMVGLEAFPRVRQSDEPGLCVRRIPYANIFCPVLVDGGGHLGCQARGFDTCEVVVRKHDEDPWNFNIRSQDTFNPAGKELFLGSQLDIFGETVDSTLASSNHVL